MIICEDRRAQEEQLEKANLLTAFGVRTVIFAAIEDAKYVFMALSGEFSILY